MGLSDSFADPRPAAPLPQLVGHARSLAGSDAEAWYSRRCKFMIYEIRTYNLKPGCVAEYEKRFADGIEVRSKYSALYGFWHTDIGPLNQVVHIWSYESLQQRADIRATASRDPSGVWPPKT